MTMETSHRDRSSRMDVSASQEPSRRRTLKASGSGRQRRRRGQSVERMPDSSAVMMTSSRMADTSAYSRGSRTRVMDGSSTYSSSGGGGSLRRSNNNAVQNNSSLQQSSSTINTAMSSMEGSSVGHTYAQKYKAAQALIDEHHQQKQKMGRRQARRRSSQGGSSAGGGSETPPGQKRTLSDKYKLISRAGTSRRQSMDSGVTETTAESNSTADSNVKLSHSHGQSNGMNGERRSKGVARSTSYSRTADKTLTATRLKKIFNPEAAPASAPPTTAAPPQGRPDNVSPLRGLRRQTSLPTHRRAPPTRRMIERKPSGTVATATTEQRTPRSTGSRRTSLPSNSSASGSGSEDSAPVGKPRRRPRQQPHDMASRTTWKTPKAKPKASLEIDALMDSSMPSLTALDLSIHSNQYMNGKRASDSSAFTLATDHTTQQPSEGAQHSRGKPILPKTPSISLLVDNAPSHAPTRKNEETDDASSVCNSLGEIYNSAASVDTTDPSATDNSRMDLSKSENTAMSKSDQSQGTGGSRMMTSSRRRAQSHDEGGIPTTTRRRRSPRALRSRSRGAIGRRTGSDRRLRQQSTSSERRQQRRTSGSGGRALARGTSASSLPKDPGQLPGPGLQRSATTSGLPKRQRSINVLQRSNTVEGNDAKPRRQKSVSSLRSAGNNSTGNKTPRRKSKKQRAKADLSESLSKIDTMSWVRGSAQTDLQAAADAALADLASGKCAASVTPSVGSGSMGSRSSRRSGGGGRRRAPIRRTMSGGSLSILSNHSAGRRRERMRRSFSVKQTPAAAADDAEARDSDATWSLADIDLGSKADPDSSVVTPPTVTSSSVEDKAAPSEVDVVAPRRTRSGVPRSRSMDGSVVRHRQASQKSLSSTASKGAKGRKQPQQGKKPEPQQGAKELKGGNKRSSKKNVFAPETDIEPFQAFDTPMDPFHIEPTEEDNDDPFSSSLHDPFAANDPFGLGKPQQPKNIHVLGQPKPNEDIQNDSFHMTNDFGDFGHESFGSVSFDNSQDFAVVPAEKSFNKSLLG